jgi:hypothetical protein
MGNGASRALKIVALMGALSRKDKRLKSTAISLCLCRIIQTILKYRKQWLRTKKNQPLRQAQGLVESQAGEPPAGVR